MKFLELTYGVSPNGFVGVRRVLPCEDKHVLGLGELQYIDTILRLYLILIVLIDCVSAALGFVCVFFFPFHLQPLLGFNIYNAYFHNFLYKISGLSLSLLFLQPLSITPWSSEFHGYVEADIQSSVVLRYPKRPSQSP